MLNRRISTRREDHLFSFNILKINTLIVFVLVSSCAGPRLGLVNSSLDNENFNTSLHGWVVFDPAKEKILHNTSGNQYFIPASNTKIATLYASLVLLPERSPALAYTVSNDSLYFAATGYPALAHPSFDDPSTLSFLKSKSNLVWVPRVFKDNRFGPGWAWEDFDRYFSTEKSAFPIYGNVLTVIRDTHFKVIPSYLQDSVTIKSKPFQRDEHRNRFYISSNLSDTLTIPLKTSEPLTKVLLEEWTQKKIYQGENRDFTQMQVLPGIETDSIVKEMFWKSDNFLAEQLLVMASSTLSDTLSTRTTINHVLDGPLKDLKHPPRWVDGSGLSRYNLFTPISFVQILQKLKAEIPEERLFTLFPNWTADGTVQKRDADTHFVYAKSGSMGNVYNLSGYLKTKSGRILIFSFMNNNFRIPSAVVRQKMYQTLKELHERY